MFTLFNKKMPPSLAYFVEIFYFPLPMYITVEGGGRGVRGELVTPSFPAAVHDALQGTFGAAMRDF